MVKIKRKSLTEGLLSLKWSRFKRPFFQYGIFSSILILAFFLRSHHLSTDLLFHRDQGVHSLAIWQIWQEKKFSLLGHTSDVSGLIHAPIYYWLMLPAYALSGGDPVSASLFQISLEVLSLPLLFFAVSRLFNRQTAWLSLIIYSISYGGISLSRWLVNVTPILPLTFLLLFLLTGTNPRIILSSLVVGVISQLNAAVGVFLLPFLFWFYRRRLNIKNVAFLLSGFFIPALPLLAFDLRHHFLIFKAIVNFSSQPGQGLGFSLHNLLANSRVFFVELGKIVSYPYSFFSALLFSLGLYKARKLKYFSFILAFLFLPILSLSFFQRGAIGFFFISLLPLALALTVYGLQTLIPIVKYSLLLFILLLNFYQLGNIYHPNNALIPIGNVNIITIQDRKNIIDWIYQKADGRQFSIWFYTIPYFQEEVWNYMFRWYARAKYNYLPEQTSGFSANDLKTSKVFFSVWEPDENQPSKLKHWKQEAVDNFGPAEKAYSSHDLYVDLHPL